MSIAQPPHICPGYSCLPALLWTPPSFLCQKVEHWGQSHEPLTDGFQEELKANKHGRNGMWNSPVILTRKSLCMNTSLPISVFICDIFPIQHPLLSGKWWRRGLVKWLSGKKEEVSYLWSTQGLLRYLTPSGSASSYLPGINLSSDLNFQFLSFLLLPPQPLQKFLEFPLWIKNHIRVKLWFSQHQCRK